MENRLNCVLDKEACIACGLCQTIASDFFDYDEEGIVLFAGEDPQKTTKSFAKEDQEIIKAIKRCPTKALTAKSV